MPNYTANLFCAIVLLGSPLVANARYQENGKVFIPKTCLLELRHPGGEVREDYDILQREFIDNSQDTGFEVVAQSETFANGIIPTTHHRQRLEPNKFLYGPVRGYFNGFASKSSEYCPAPQVAVGTWLALDVVPTGQPYVGAYGYFKNSTPKYPSIFGWSCISPDYTKEQWEKARFESVKNLITKLPSCDQFWTESEPFLAHPLLELSDWKNPAKEEVLTCSTTDKLDPITIKIFTLPILDNVANLMMLVTANHETVGTTSTTPEIQFKNSSYLGSPNNYHVYFGFGYESQNPNKMRSSSGFFIDRLKATFETKMQEMASGPWPGDIRDRNLRCQLHE